MPRKTGKNGHEDLTLQVLREIRDAIGLTNKRLDETRAELSSRIDETNRRLVESETRLATAILGMKGALDEVRDLLREQGDLRPRVERLEKHVGIGPPSAT